MAKFVKKNLFENFTIFKSRVINFIVNTEKERIL